MDARHRQDDGARRRHAGDLMDIAQRRRHRSELRRRRFVRSHLLVLLLAAALAGCTGGDGGGVDVSAAPRPEGDRAYGDTLIRALAANISGLIPNITGDKYSHDAVSLIYNGLISHDKDTNIIPDLAESWTLAPDCKEVSS